MKRFVLFMTALVIFSSVITACGSQTEVQETPSDQENTSEVQENNPTTPVSDDLNSPQKSPTNSTDSEEKQKDNQSYLNQESILIEDRSVAQSDEESLGEEVNYSEENIAPEVFEEAIDSEVENYPPSSEEEFNEFSESDMEDGSYESAPEEVIPEPAYTEQ